MDPSRPVSRIRVATPGDGAAVAAIYAPIVRDTVISFEVDPPPAEEMARRIAATLPSHPWLVLQDDAGEVLGYAYATAHRQRAAYRWSADVSAYVAEHARRRGIARRLYGALAGILRRQGLHAAYAGITLPNDASVGLHQALGFTPVGVYREVGWKFGRWLDVGWWRLPLSPSQEPPGEPVPFARLHAAGELLGRGEPAADAAAGPTGSG